MWFLVSFRFISVGSFLFCMLESVGFLAGWVVLELLSLRVTPYFFFEVFPRSQRALLQYMLISGLSSFFMLCGAFSSNFQWILVGVGVIMKLGVFPFMSWMYEVVIHSNWFIVWFFSGVLKVPFVLVLYMLGPGSFPFKFFCVSCFIVLGLNLWKGLGGWRRCWCHMIVSGSARLVIIGMLCSTEISFYVYWVYFVWVTLGLRFFYFLPNARGVSDDFIVYCFVILFISFPFGVAIFYKYAIGMSLLIAKFYIFVSWCFYTISEQLFLIYFLISRGKVRSRVSLFSFI